MPDLLPLKAAGVPAFDPNGFGSNWCGVTGIAKLSPDLTAMANLK